MTCKRSTNLLESWLDTETRIQKGMIRKNTKVLQRLEELHRQKVDRGQEVDGRSVTARPRYSAAEAAATGRHVHQDGAAGVGGLGGEVDGVLRLLGACSASASLRCASVVRRGLAMLRNIIVVFTVVRDLVVSGRPARPKGLCARAVVGSSIL